MSYLNRKHTNHRTATIIAVTAIEAAAIFAVVQGLSVNFVPRPVPQPFEGTQVRLDPPPVPAPTPLPSAQPSHRTDPIAEHHNDFGAAGLIIPVAPLPIASPMPLATPDTIIEPPKPPQFTPHAARPLGRVPGWATPNDYPARDLREGNQGVTGFRLTIGSDGKVVSCTVTSSSGFPGLDRATCENVSRRARFEPASDATGARVPSSYANSIRWVIPE